MKPLQSMKFYFIQKNTCMLFLKELIYINKYSDLKKYFLMAINGNKI